jgi:hypothetical protein
MFCMFEETILVDFGGGRVLGNARTSKQVETNKPITSNKHHLSFVYVHVKVKRVPSECFACSRKPYVLMI